MNVLVINSGSSSIKFQLFEMPEKTVICHGMVERIGLKNSTIHYKTQQQNIEQELPIENHAEGLKQISGYLMDQKDGVIKDVDDITIIGHRVVHGGRSFSETTLITREVKDEIKALFGLAPLHNPPNLIGIEVAEKIFPNAKQVAVLIQLFINPYLNMHIVMLFLINSIKRALEYMVFMAQAISMYRNEQ